jgi:hypothetical protein
MQKSGIIRHVPSAAKDKAKWFIGVVPFHSAGADLRRRHHDATTGRVSHDDCPDEDSGDRSGDEVAGQTVCVLERRDAHCQQDASRRPSGPCASGLTEAEV